MQQKELTGYPSIDKPWLKWYDDGAERRVIPDSTMYSLLYESNKPRLDNIAIKYFDTDISYKVLFEKIKITAGMLTAKGVKEGDIISILSLNTPETIYTIYALNYIGAVANLLMVGISESELHESLKKTNSKLFFIMDKLFDQYNNLSDLNCPIIIFNIFDSAKGFKYSIIKGLSKKNRQHESFGSAIVRSYSEPIFVEKPDSMALILYTSGTTGKSKGVILSSRNLNAMAIQCTQTKKNYKPSDTFLNAIPPFLGFGIGMLHLCFYAGMEQIAVLVPQIEDIIKSMVKYHPNRYVMGPAFTDVIEKYPEDKMDFLVDLTGGGGAVPLEKERSLNNILQKKQAKSKYYVGYGMTELASGVSLNDEEHWKEQSVGIPLPLTNFKVCDTDSGRELPYNKEGELFIAAPNLMLGYYCDDDATNEAIDIDKGGTRWLHTGDIARIDEDGFVYITGRIKRIYITKDKNGIVEKIFPQRIEETIEGITCVSQCAVIVIPDAEKQNVPIVFVVVNNEQDAGMVKHKVLAAVEKYLPEYYAPVEIILCDDFPTTQSQKIDYKELEKRYFTKNAVPEEN